MLSISASLGRPIGVVPGSPADIPDFILTLNTVENGDSAKGINMFLDSKQDTT
jgi:hypothetical protein